MEEGVRDRLELIDGFREAPKLFVAIGQKEFRERHRVDLQEVDLADRKGRGQGRRSPEQGACAGDVVLGGVFAKVLQRIDDFRRVLNIVENDQRFAWGDPLAGGEHQVLKDAPHVMGGIEELPEVFIFVKVEVGDIPVMTLPELLEQPGLADLSNAVQNQRLAAAGLLPVEEFLHQKAFHVVRSSHFYTNFCDFHHTFM